MIKEQFLNSNSYITDCIPKVKSIHCGMPETTVDHFLIFYFSLFLAFKSFTLSYQRAAYTVISELVSIKDNQKFSLKWKLAQSKNKYFIHKYITVLIFGIYEKQKEVYHRTHSKRPKCKLLTFVS